MVWDSLLDIPFSQKLANSTVQVDPSSSQYLNAWLGYLDRNTKSLINLLSQDDLTPPTKLTVLNYLEKMEQISMINIEHEHQKILEKDLDDTSIVNAYIALLMKQDMHHKVRETAQNWLNNNRHHPGLFPIDMKTKIAQSYLRENRLDSAWRIIKDVYPSYKANAMLTAIDILDAKGDLNTAEEIAQEVHARYPDVVNLNTRLAKFYWKHAKYQKAANLLSSSRIRIDQEDWRFIVGKEFVDEFKNKSDQIALDAYKVLLSQGIKHEYLFEIATAVGNAGRFRLAIQMIKPLKYPGFGQTLLLIRSYSYLKKIEGRKKALAWLDTQIPKQMRNPVSMIAYGEKHYELLWTLISNPDEGSHSDFVWLMRASAYLKQQKKEKEQYLQLQNYYKKHKSGYYNTIGRYLLKMIKDEDILSLITDKKSQCEIAYYIGLRSQTDGDYENASHWYRTSIETGLIKNSEYRWSYDQLYRWHNKGKNLSIIARAE